jgi:hypothetical protein
MEEEQERTTREVIDTLGEDCRRCHSELLATIDAGVRDEDGGVTAEYEYQARQLIRAVFAYFEAVTYSVKVWSANHCMENDIPIAPQERYFATDTKYEINPKGEIVETVAKISLARNIRFAIYMNRKAHGIYEPFNASIEWWSCLKCAIKVRDRLTHPKLPGDLDVSGEDIVNALKARGGYEHELLSVGKP